MRSNETPDQPSYLNIPETMDDETLDFALDVANSTRPYVSTEKGLAFLARIDREVARRAEIKIERGMAAQYGPNPYGFTLDDVYAKHDASWYASRQTEEQFLDEMGAH